MDVKVLLAEFVWQDLLTRYAHVVLNFIIYADAHLKPCQTSIMELFCR